MNLLQTIYTDPGAVRVESKLVLRSIETLPEFKDLFVGRRRPPWAMILSALLGGMCDQRDLSCTRMHVWGVRSSWQHPCQMQCERCTVFWVALGTHTLGPDFMGGEG